MVNNDGNIRNVDGSDNDSDSDTDDSLIFSFSDEICAVIKLDSTYMNQTNWKPYARDAWEQEFRVELERVSSLMFTQHGSK